MKTRTKKTALVAVTALIVVGSVTAAALASSRGTTAPKPAAPAVASATPDADNIQSGDQTSPDTGTEAPEATSGTKATQDEPGGETPDSETGGEDGGATSDGPGGHEDPPGQDVNHEYNGEE